MVLVLPSFSDERSGSVALNTCRLFPLTEEAVEMLALMGVVEALKAQGLIGPVVVHTFVHRRILPLRERVHPLWSTRGSPPDDGAPLSHLGGIAQGAND